MTYVITDLCVGVLDGSCVKVCPVDCIYVGKRSRYINPTECIDCGACEPVCPAQAIFPDTDVPAERSGYIADNELFFRAILPGRATPVGNPRGAKKIGDIGIDTPLIAALPDTPPE